jgi:hypothetical protein
MIEPLQRRDAAATMVLLHGDRDAAATMTLLHVPASWPCEVMRAHSVFNIPHSHFRILPLRTVIGS